MTEYTTRVDHTAKAFDTDLQEITRKVAEMGGLAERQISHAVQALVERDVELGERVISLDPAIDALQREVEEKAILTIARRQPMAVDLRDIIGACLLYTSAATVLPASAADITGAGSTFVYPVLAK